MRRGPKGGPALTWEALGAGQAAAKAVEGQVAAKVARVNSSKGGGVEGPRAQKVAMQFVSVRSIGWYGRVVNSFATWAEALAHAQAEGGRAMTCREYEAMRR